MPYNLALSAVVGVVTNNSPYIPISQSFTLLNGCLVTTPTMARGHAEFISVSIRTVIQFADNS
jgi:hypothetical protein